MKKKCVDCIIGISVLDAYVGGNTCTETEVFIDNLFDYNNISRFNYCPICRS